MNSLPAEYKNLCRGCFSEISDTHADILNIFQIKVEQKNLSQMFMACTGCNISVDDKLPHMICGPCQTLLISAYKFRSKCINSNNKFHSILKNSSSIETNKSLNFWMPSYKVEIKNESNEPNTETVIHWETKNVDSQYNSKNSDNDRDCEISLQQSSNSESINNQTKYDENPFKCKKCIKSYSTRKSLKRHIRSLGCGGGDDVSRQQKYDENPFKCKKCKKSYSLKKSLTRHIRLSGCSDDVVKAKQQKYDEKPFKYESDTDFETFKCKTCRCEFASKELLTTHKCNHVNIKESIGIKYKCTFCEHIYFSQAEFMRHMIDQHDGACIYSCWLCDQKFHSNSGLHSHLRTHPEQMPYLCQECGKTFTGPSNLKNHIISHTAEKRFNCDKCPMKFTTKGKLKFHLLTHSTEKPFECDLCHRKFHRKCLIISHMYIHSGTRPLPFSCEVCAKKFYNVDRLRRHRRVHTGEKPFKCNFCKVAYSQNNDLNKHLRVHIGENTYSCKECDESFRLKRDLTIHENKHYLDKLEKNENGNYN